MKKILLTTALIVTCLITSKGFALDCPNGDIITGLNNKEYCVSKVTMNWFSAFAWCDAQGLRMPTVNEVCDNGTDVWNGDTGNYKCLNMPTKWTDKKRIWTADQSGKNNAYIVYTDYAQGIGPSSRTERTGTKAGCIAK